jgi:small subunit ribosomal protein S6
VAKANAPIAKSITDQRRARAYEMIYILRSSVHPDEADRIAARFFEIVKNLNGKLVNFNNWGRRRLAYPIKKESRGVFVYARFLGYENLVAELERNMRLLDSVLRYQTILLKPRVNMDEIAVDPADVQFQRLELIEEDDEPQLAQRLGLVERPKGQAPELDAFRADPDTLEDEYMEGGEEFNAFGQDDDNFGLEGSQSSVDETERRPRKKSKVRAKSDEKEPSDEQKSEDDGVAKSDESDQE